MTTIAWDGKSMAADSMLVGSFGLVSRTQHKIRRGRDYIVGWAGNYAQYDKWWAEAELLSFSEVFKRGYPEWKDGENDPAIMIIYDGLIYLHTQGLFYLHEGTMDEVLPCWAIGTGRDFALGAMASGKSAFGAVLIASNFDQSTGGNITEVTP